MDKDPTKPGAGGAPVTRLHPPRVTTQITRTMPLQMALQLSIENAGKDPNDAWAVFDVSTAIIAGDPLPPQGERFVVVFRDFTYCEVLLAGETGSANDAR